MLSYGCNCKVDVSQFHVKHDTVSGIAYCVRAYVSLFVSQQTRMEKEGRAVEVVHGIWAVHWKFSICAQCAHMCTVWPVHTARLGRVFFGVFSLGLCFVCSFVLFDFFVCPPFFCVSLSSWVISLTVFGASVTNLSKPPRALATSTIAWVRS